MQIEFSLANMVSCVTRGRGDLLHIETGRGGTLTHVTQGRRRLSSDSGPGDTMTSRHAPVVLHVSCHHKRTESCQMSSQMS